MSLLRQLALLMLALLVLLLILGSTALDQLDRPSMYVRESTGKCLFVQVWVAQHRAYNYSCENHPDRYEEVLLDDYDRVVARN